MVSHGVTNIGNTLGVRIERNKERTLEEIIATLTVYATTSVDK
jgi:hypothetical protein